MLASCTRLVPAGAATAASAGTHPPAGPPLQNRAAAKPLVVASNAATAGTELLPIVPPTPAELTSAVLITVVPVKGLAGAALAAAAFIRPPLGSATATASGAGA